MNVLFLGPANSRTAAFLRAEGETVTVWADRIDAETTRRLNPELVVSHGYSYILESDVLEAICRRAVNLHISYLPWNRGADPNLWSWIERTPKGVTIHHIDDGIDTGDIIAQRNVEFDDGETLASSYERLQAEMLTLFQEEWPAIRAGSCARRPQAGPGTFHRLADRARVEHLLVAGWDTPVSLLLSGDTGRRDHGN
jgi:methionyl-tRNA formyltransferase